MEAGQLVMSCKPFAYVVWDSKLASVCDYCWTEEKPEDLKVCTGCKTVRFCQSESCRDSSKKENIHSSMECDLMAKAFPDFPSEQVRLISRILFKQRSSRHADELDKLPNGKERGFQDLEHHSDKMAKDRRLVKSFSAVKEDLATYLNEDLDETEEAEVFRIFGKIQINRFNRSQGIALYLGLSAIDHSCSPNAEVVGDLTSQVSYSLRLLEDVESFDEIRICYGSKLFVERTETRRSGLKSRYYFDCQCRSCQEVELDSMKSSLKCRLCKGCVPISSGRCVDCSLPVSDEYLFRHRILTAKMTDKQGTVSNEDITEIIELFHHFDLNKFKLLEQCLAQKCPSNIICDLGLFLGIGLQVLEFHEKFYPAAHEDTVAIELKMVQILVKLNFIELALQHLQKAMKQMKTLGYNLKQQS